MIGEQRDLGPRRCSTATVGKLNILSSDKSDIKVASPRTGPIREPAESGAYEGGGERCGRRRWL